MNRGLAALALIGGCAMGINEETRLTALTVVALPLASADGVTPRGDWLPGEANEVALVIGDPSLTGDYQGLVFLCTGFGAGCAEASLEVPLSSLAQVISDDLVGVVTVPSLPPGALPPGAAVGVWALACRPGRCDDLLDAVRADPAPGSDAWASLWGRLGDPGALLDGVALDDASLASRFVPLVVDAQAPRNLPPALLVVDAPATIAPEGELVFRVDVTHASLDATPDDDGQPDSPGAELVGFGLATGGGFLQRSDHASDGSARLRWVAPEEAGPAELLMVVNDGLGGQSAVRHRVVVVAP